MVKKNILVITHFFYPETGAASIRMQSFVSVLKSAGYNIKIIAPKPNYPQGKIYLGYEKNYIKNKSRDITYLPILFTKNSTPIGRLFSYLSYFFASVFYSLFLRFNPDVVLSSSPPLFTAFGGLLVAKFKRAKFILDIRDIWPDIGVQLGLINSKLSLSILSATERVSLNHSNHIVVTTSGDKVNLISKRVHSERVSVIYNGADVDVFTHATEKQKVMIRKKYTLPVDRKIMIYFGSYNFGMNDVEILCQSLKELSDHRKSFHFVSIGEGNLRNGFEKKIANAINYTMLPSLPINEVADIISASDFSLIPRKKIELDTGGNLPVKCFESLSAGIPFLLSVNEGDESSRIFANKNFAELIPAGDKQALKEAIEKLIQSDTTENTGSAGRKFVTENFSRKMQSKKLLDIMNSLINL